jgi:hypothetical protein
MATQKKDKIFALDTLSGEAQKLDNEDGLVPPPKSHPEDDEGIGRFLPIRFPLFHWKTFILFVICCLGLVLQWFFTSDLFKIPASVSTSRNAFFNAKEHYESNSLYWDAKQRQFDDFIHQEITGNNPHEIIQKLYEAPPEVFMSFLVTRMHLSSGRLDHIVIFPKENTSNFTIVMSKYEQGIWPLKIMLSLEFEVKLSRRKFSINFTRLRRGAQDLALGLCWAYFGPELERLRELELIPTQLHFAPR